MRRELNWALAAVVLVCGCVARSTFKEPPPDTYAARTYQVRVGDNVTSVAGATVTPGFFNAAGVQPRLGRHFVEADQAPSATGVVTLGDALWKDRFASSPEIIGRTIEVDGRPATIVGVAPPGFSFPGASLIWTLKNSDASPSTRTEACRAATEPEIRALFDRWNGSLQTGDPQKVVANYAERSILLPTMSDTPRLTAAEKEDYFHHFLAKKPVGRIDSGTIEIGCNTAVDAGLYTFTFGTSDPPIKARYTYTYKWDGTGWWITSHHSSAMPETR
jgi:hypothetical protein